MTSTMDMSSTKFLTIRDLLSSNKPPKYMQIRDVEEWKNQFLMYVKNLGSEMLWFLDNEYTCPNEDLSDMQKADYNKECVMFALLTHCLPHDDELKSCKTTHQLWKAIIGDGNDNEATCDDAKKVDVDESKMKFDDYDDDTSDDLLKFDDVDDVADSEVMDEEGIIDELLAEKLPTAESKSRPAEDSPVQVISEVETHNSITHAGICSNCDKLVARVIDWEDKFAQLKESSNKLSEDYELLHQAYTDSTLELRKLTENYRTVSKSDREVKEKIESFKNDKIDLSAMVATLQKQLDISV